MTPVTKEETMILGTQYYRPPFPERRYWHDDLAAMVDAGLDTVQLWACWGWIEAGPGKYRFDDYDDLVSMAGSVGLQVVISTVAEIQPFWIPRLLPGSEMVDHFGRVVRSSLRQECNVGLTPGGCFDHPGVRDKLGAFLEEIGRRYRGAEALFAWDCWNETRWAVQADAYVCYCHHTVAAYREWLRGRYGDLEGLGAAWHRRYDSWDDVVPGKSPGRPYTDLVEFEAFLTWRSARHAAFRAGRLRDADGSHLVLAHCGKPAVFSSGSEFEQAVSRGNDFDLAEVLDGFGCSHFPAWEHYSVTELGSRIEEICSAVGSKPAWVSELQGGGARSGLGVWPAVDPGAQQRWVWGAYGRGIKAVLFWCWRDEVFGRESSGFGLMGSDGQSAGRLELMAQTGRVLKQNDALFDGYRPDPPEVGVLFSQGSYQLDWAQNGNQAAQASGSMLGWLSLFERTQLPYRVVDSARPTGLDGLRLIVVPWPLVVPVAMGEALAEWVRAGGTLVTEAELDAFNEQGFYRYPEDRPLACALGLTSRGRRAAGEAASMSVSFGTRRFDVPVAGWLEALGSDEAEVLATSAGGETLAIRRHLGRGSVFALGSFPGSGYRHDRCPDLEAFLRELATAAGVVPPLELQPADGEIVQWRLGRSGEARLLFITAEPPVTAVSARLPKHLIGPGSTARVIIGRGAGPVGATSDWTELEVLLSPQGVGVVEWAAPDGHRP